MNEKIANAIVRSASRDEIVHVDIDKDECNDIIALFEGVPVDDFIQLEHGEWDVWGTDDDAGEWRLHIYFV